MREGMFSGSSRRPGGAVDVGSRTRTAVLFTVVVLLTVGLSWLSSRMTFSGDEAPQPQRVLRVKDGMTVEQFGRENELGRPVLRDVFDLTDAAQLQKPLADFRMSGEELNAAVSRSLALQSESASKDWGKIRIKFALWIILLAGVFALVRRHLVTSRVRVGLYAVSVLVFGVLLGSDPSPMGTVKDAVVLYGTAGAIFRPRVVALLAFLLMVVLANKFICGWGCQFGVLQDLILRLRTGRNGVPTPWKPPFAVTNSIRIAFFLSMVLFAFGWALDIIDPIDPFKIYKPAALTVAGGAFLVVVLVASLFLYRPWCHLFCPFGLVGWVAEKLSIFKIQVDYNSCIDCGACVKACPSSVMGAILKRDRVIPDCFACGSCVEVCPVNAVDLKAGRRSIPGDR